MIRILLIVLAGVISFAFVASCQPIVNLEPLLRDEYPKLILLGFEKGQFTGSSDLQYLAFYEDPKQRYESDSPRVIWRVVVFRIQAAAVRAKYDLHSLDAYTLEYGKRDLEIIQNPRLQFGRWAGYAYIGDYNGNGLEEILFFMLSGSYFLPTIIEFNGKEFATVLEFNTYSNELSEIRTETHAGQKLLRLYGYGRRDTPEGKRDWYLYAWSEKIKRYEIIESGIE